VVVVVAEIKPADYEAIDKLVGTSYGSIQQFVEVAVRNQLALEGGLNGFVDLPDHVPPRAHERKESSPLMARQGSTAVLSQPTTDANSVKPTPGSTDDEWLPWVGAIDPTAVATGAEISVPDLPLWGQINRVLPIAAGVRVLAHIAESAEQPFVSVDEWHAKAADAAVGLRARLEAIDSARNHRHGERWATAFPEDERTSRKRYVQQFLGYVRPNGQPEGGAARLGFVSFADGDPSKVSLTRGGAAWASLQNPIFDGTDVNARGTFSREEAERYLDHVRHKVPAEYHLMTVVAGLVDRGKARTEIDDRLGELYPDWSRYIGTVRAGALGRLQDLGLLRRERRGLHVDYGLTDLSYELRLIDEKGVS
jgi:hypothetical protein